MTVVTDPYSELAGMIETAVLTEFVDEPYLEVRHDRLHESLGYDGRTYVGISPESEPTDGIDMRVEVLVQFYGPFNTEVDPQQQVDPRIIANKAERLRRALGAVDGSNQHMWFFNVINTRYPTDATGNKTRFEMTVVGRGSNAQLVETIG